MKNETPPIIHLALADDHDIVRNGICAIISSFGGFEIDIQVSSGEELIRRLGKAKPLPDICLVDINMPGKNGYDTLKEIKSKWPEMKFLVLTMFNNEFSIMRMLRNGANGYILKNSNPNELKKALTTIYLSDYYHSELISNRIHNSLKNEDKLHPKINDKEVQFLSLCCNDCNYKEIAEIMGVSPRTVEGYRDTLFQKLNIKTRTGLAMYAISTGIVPFSER